MKYLILVFAMMVTVLSSCNNGDGEAETAAETPSESKSVSEHDGKPLIPLGEVIAQLERDDQQMWPVNEATQRGMERINMTYEHFRSNDKKDWASLGADIKKDLDDIIAKCDMKGEPHDKLHLILVRMFRHCDELATTDMGRGYDELGDIIQMYFMHFTHHPEGPSNPDQHPQ